MSPRIAVTSAWRIGVAAALLLAATACTRTPEEGLTVAAASSLAPAITAVTAAAQADGGLETTIVLGASVDLAEQIRSGAPVGLFLSADPDLLDTLEAEGLLAGPPIDIGRGTLSIVLSAEAGPLGPPSISLLALPAVERVVIADPRHAPFGAAARQALEAAGLWETIEEKIVFAGSALQAVDVVRTGNAQAGIVPTSLLADVNLASTAVPIELYDPPRYAAAMIRGSSEDQASVFLEILLSAKGRGILETNGLVPVGSG